MKKTTSTETIKTTATATATIETKNSEKVNTILNIDGIRKLFVECNVLPKYTDHEHYVGTGISRNVCSVNVTKSQYNVYCDDTVFKTLTENKIDSCIYTENGNSSSTRIPHKIEINTTDNLKKLLTTVANNYKMYTIA